MLINLRFIGYPTRAAALSAIGVETAEKKMCAYSDAGGGLFFRLEGEVLEFARVKHKRWEAGGGYQPNDVVYYPDVPHGPWWVFSTEDTDSGEPPSSENYQWTGYQYMEDIISYLLRN